MENENIVRTILKNEITWLVFLAGAVMTFVYRVIIPINSMQIQLTQIQSDIAQVKTFDARITDSANKIIILQEQVRQLEKK